MPRLDSDGVHQAVEIGRATIAGYLQSDLMPPGMQAPALIWAVAFFAGPSLLLPVEYLHKYAFLWHYLPGRVADALVRDRLLFLVLSSCAIGLIAVVLWDTLFPSRRDAVVLGPLPVAPSSQIAGRLLGLGALFVAFTVALNAVPSIVFPLVSAPDVESLPRLVAGHAVAGMTANAFVFFSVTSIQGLILIAGGPRLSSRLGSAAQGIATLLVLFAILFLGGLQERMVAAFRDPAAHAAALTWFPLAWFSGLYETITHGRPLPAGVAARAVLAATAPLALTVAVYVLGYKRLMARAIETRGRRRQAAGIRLAGSLLRRTVLRDSEVQAVSSFLVRVLARSPRHRMLVSAAVGGALAVIAAGVVPDVLRHGGAVFAAPTSSVLAAPLVLSAALAVSLRLVMTIPVDPMARWVLQTAPLSPRRVDAATHRSFLLLVLPPVAVLAFATAWPLWGLAIATRHAAFSTALALLLCEVLLHRFRGVPCARPYVPGGTHLHVLWPGYLAVFIIYTYGMAAIERALPEWTVLMAAAASAVALVIWTTRRWRRRSETAVAFEPDLPDTTFPGFNLTEAYAAERQYGRQPPHENSGD
jgi:hypothetical protein